MNKKSYMRSFSAAGRSYTLFDIRRLDSEGIADISRLPFSIRVLVENLLRKMDGQAVREENLIRIARWQKRYDAPVEIPYHPARVLMQDFTGVPAVADLAAMRDAVRILGADPATVNPRVPVDLIVDHSIQVDSFGTRGAVEENVRKEYQRNEERYAFLKWAQQSFSNFRVVPPRSGICHQINLEHLARVVMTGEEGGQAVAYPDTLVGLDSHTTMIDAVGVLGWGVGGIEAEAVMLGQPYYFSIPEVIGVRFTGELGSGVTATDLVLTVTQMLREYGVVEKFVEFFGEGIKKLPIPYRATISNMTPEYGATLGFFPVDEETIHYLHLTGRKKQAGLVAAYARENALFYTGEDVPDYTDVLELDLGTVKPCVSGPAMPKERIDLPDLKNRFARLIGCDPPSPSPADAGRSTRHTPLQTGADIDHNGRPVKLGNGSVVIAAITSCTNTSNPWVMIGAGLMAKKAVAHGLKVPPYVKTTLTPGSRVVMRYLSDAGLLPYLEALGFHLAGFGCATCIGNGGPLNPAIEQCIVDNELNVAAVLSGNRNFQARIHQNIKSNFLASPMLVVAYALAGHIDIDLNGEPVGLDPNGAPVFLEDIWPSEKEISAAVDAHVKTELFEGEYGCIFDGDEFWNSLPDARSVTYPWDSRSTYIKNPPYFEGFCVEPRPVEDISAARVLLMVGDAVTTDHISPAGAIPKDYPAGRYLITQGVAPADFNSYGSRRGNHEVMMRGTFGNIRLKNRLVDGREGSFTRKYPEGEDRFIYEAAMAYQAEQTPMVILAGRDYGAGSSRDWAAKGTRLLGVRAVIAESFERIHRSNLVGMGVLPMVFGPGENAGSLGLDGSERFFIKGLAAMEPRRQLTVSAEKADGSDITFTATVRLDTDVEVAYFKNGGILPCVLRNIVAGTDT